MSTALSLVLSGMVASYETVEPSAPVSKIPAKVVKAKVAPQSATVKVANPSAHEVKPSDVKAEPLPQPKTISAWEFLAIAASFNVSWTDSVTPTRHTTPKQGTSREDMIRAIAAYCGWNPALDFGTQEKNARRQAQCEVNPALGIKPMAAKPSLTIAGLVAGMPDHQGKRYADLKGRERLAVDTIVEHEKLSKVATTDQDRQTHEALAQVERERLVQIRKDLAAEFG